MTTVYGVIKAGRILVNQCTPQDVGGMSDLTLIGNGNLSSISRSQQLLSPRQVSNSPETRTPRAQMGNLCTRALYGPYDPGDAEFCKISDCLYIPVT